MSSPQKIATCCYCGTRAALVLRGRDRHELSCSACGAPLHDLKMLPRARQQSRKKSVSTASISSDRRKKVQRKVKKRKSLFSRVLEEAWDVVEDVFD
ncbi:hypothetical protein [Ruegeria jejuensis]|uniref:hypothetical protein n=1 Tax=Ruegeria jejuensis TaxID=3233338 RepID=UPI00355B67F6